MTASAAAKAGKAGQDRRPQDGRRFHLARRLECSVEMPWGVHASLEGHRCPRCGWHRH